uniref:Uncharacterized protein n=1 Tax=Anopheles coluzzii TaxID=1518534 RepID=A0A8W7PNB0_ANOCL
MADALVGPPPWMISWCLRIDFILAFCRSYSLGTGDSISSVTGPSFTTCTCIIAPNRPSSMRSVAYSFRILCSSDSYSCCASGPCMARLKSGRLPFNRWYSVNWLTHSISSCRSTTDSDHRLPLEGFSNSRKLSNFRALERDDKTPGEFGFLAQGLCTTIAYPHPLHVASVVVGRDADQHAQATTDRAHQFIAHCNEGGKGLAPLINILATFAVAAVRAVSGGNDRIVAVLGHADDDVITDAEINVGCIGRIQRFAARIELHLASGRQGRHQARRIERRPNAARTRRHRLGVRVGLLMVRQVLRSGRRIGRIR